MEFLSTTLFLYNVFIHYWINPLLDETKKTSRKKILQEGKQHASPHRTVAQISQNLGWEYWATHLSVCLYARMVYSFVCIVAADRLGHPHFHPLWFRFVKNQDISTGPLTCLFACSLALLTHLLAPHCSLCSPTPLRSFVCLLVHFVHSQAFGKVCNFVSKLLYFKP